VRVFITFNLVSFTWIFFRANNLPDAVYIATHLVRGIGSSLRLLLRSLVPQVSLAGLTIFIQPLLLGQDSNSVFILLGILLVALAAAVLHARPKSRDFPLNQPLAIRWGIYYLVLFAILFLGVFTSYQFIYNQF
jgi:alginate O-acetyltransferase complex protein AlgI